MRLLRTPGWKLVVLLLFPGLCLASGSRKQEADALTSVDHSKTWSLPAATDTLVGRASSDTLTNKTISGGSNTLSQLPVGTQIVQTVPTGTVNGSNVTFTISPTPAVPASVQLYLDGSLLLQGGGNDYTISTNTITMNTAPATAQRLIAVYSQF